MGCNSSKQTIYLIQDGKKVNVDKWASKDIQFEKSGTTSNSMTQHNRTSNNTPNSNLDRKSVSPNTTKKNNERTSNEAGSAGRNSVNKNNERQQQMLKYFNQATIRERDFPFGDNFRASFDGSSPDAFLVAKNQSQNLPQLYNQIKSSEVKLKENKIQQRSDKTKIDDIGSSSERVQTFNSNSGIPLADKIIKNSKIDQMEVKRRLQQETDQQETQLKKKNVNGMRIKNNGQNNKFNNEFSKIQGSSRQNSSQIPIIIDYSQQNPFKPIQHSSLKKIPNSKKISSQSNNNAFTLNAPQISQTNGSRTELNEYEYTFQAKFSPPKYGPSDNHQSNLTQKSSSKLNRFQDLKMNDFRSRSGQNFQEDQNKKISNNTLKSFHYNSSQHNRIYTQNNSPNHLIQELKTKTQLQHDNSQTFQYLYNNQKNQSSLNPNSSSHFKYKHQQNQQELHHRKVQSEMKMTGSKLYSTYNADGRGMRAASSNSVNRMPGERNTSNKTIIINNNNTINNKIVKIVQYQKNTHLNQLVVINNNIKIIHKNEIIYKDDINTPGRSLRNAYHQSVSSHPKKKSSNNIYGLKKNFDLSKEQEYISQKYINQKRQRKNFRNKKEESKVTDDYIEDSQQQTEELLQRTSISNQNTQLSGIIKQQSLLEKSSIEEDQDEIDSLASQVQNNLEPLPIIKEQPIYPDIEEQNLNHQKRQSILIQRKRISSARESRRISQISQNMLSVNGSQTSLQNIKEHITTLSQKRTSRSLSMKEKSDEENSQNSDKLIFPQINIIGLGGEKTQVDSSYHQNSLHNSLQPNHLRVSQNSMNSQSYYKKINNYNEMQQNQQQQTSLHPMRASNNFSDMKRELKLQMASMTIKQLKNQIQDKSFSEKNSPRQVIQSLQHLQNSLGHISMQQMQKSIQGSLNFNNAFSKFKKDNQRKKQNNPQGHFLSDKQNNQFNIKITPHSDDKDNDQSSQSQFYHDSSNHLYTLKISNDPQNSQSIAAKTFSFGTRGYNDSNHNEAIGTVQSYTYNIPTIIHSSIQNSNNLYDQDDNQLNLENQDGYDTPKSKYSDGQKIDIVTNLLKPSNDDNSYLNLDQFSSYSMIKQSQERTNLLRQSFQDAGQHDAQVNQTPHKLSPGPQFSTNILRHSMQQMQKKESEKFSPNFKIVIENNNQNDSSSRHHPQFAESIQVSSFQKLDEPEDNQRYQNEPSPIPIPLHIAKKMNNLYSSKNMHHSDVRLNIPAMAAISTKNADNAQDVQNQKSFMFDSIMLQSNDQINNYTQYSGSRKGSNMLSNQSIRESKQADFNSYSGEDLGQGDDDNILNLVTESEISHSEEEIYHPPKEINFLIESMGKKKAGSGQGQQISYGNNIQGSSASVVYNVKGSSSDVLRNPSSQVSGLVSVDRGTNSQNRQVQFKNSDKTFSKYSSQNMMKFLNRIMQLDDEDEDDEFFNHDQRTSSITPNVQNMQFLSSVLDINAINKDSDGLIMNSMVNNHNHHKISSGGNNPSPPIPNQIKKRSLNDGDQQLAQHFAQEVQQQKQKRPKKTSKIKVIKNRRSINYVEYKFPDENNN